MANIMLANGLNASQVRRWLCEHGVGLPSRRKGETVELARAAEPRFVPVTLVPAAEPRSLIRLDV